LGISTTARMPLFSLLRYASALLLKASGGILWSMQHFTKGIHAKCLFTKGIRTKCLFTKGICTKCLFTKGIRTKCLLQTKRHSCKCLFSKGSLRECLSRKKAVFTSAFETKAKKTHRLQASCWADIIIISSYRVCTGRANRQRNGRPSSSRAADNPASYSCTSAWPKTLPSLNVTEWMRMQLSESELLPKMRVKAMERMFDQCHRSKTSSHKRTADINNYHNRQRSRCDRL